MPELTSRGCVYERDAGELMIGAVERLLVALRETSRMSKRGLDEATREALTRYFYDHTGRRPTIVTLILEA